MKKSENDKIFEAYSRAAGSEYEQLDEWGKPVNRLGQFAKGFVSGKSGVPGSGLVSWLGKKIAPNLVNRAAGNWEVGQETNRLWDLFNRDVLSRSPTPTGKQVKGWFQTVAKMSPQANKVLAAMPDGKVYDEPTLQGLVKDAVSEQQKIWAGAQDDGGSQYSNDEKWVPIIAQLSIDEKKQLIITLNKQGDTFPPAAPKPPTAAGGVGGAGSVGKPVPKGPAGGTPEARSNAGHGGPAGAPTFNINVTGGPQTQTGGAQTTSTSVAGDSSTDNSVDNRVDNRVDKRGQVSQSQGQAQRQ